MASDVTVTPDQVSIGVLVSSVPRDVIDAAVAARGVGVKRSGGTLPAHVVVYLTLALCLFPDDDYTEVATKVTGSLSRFGCWDASWRVPTSSGITQARRRVGSAVLADVFEGVAQPVATMSTRGAWLRRWRLLAIDGFDADLPDTPQNVAEFGYAGSGGALLWRAPTQLRLPVVAVLADGTYSSVVINPAIRGARRDRIVEAARAGGDLDPDDAHLVRVIEYDVPDRVGNGTGELIVLLSTIVDPADARSDELAAAYHDRWEEETANDQLKTHLRGPGRVLRSRLPDLVRQEIWAWLSVHYAVAVLVARAAEAADLDPDRISFTRTLRLVRRTATGTAAFPP